MELPLIIQDKALLTILAAKNVQLAFEYFKFIAQVVEEVGGVLTILWHPCSISRKYVKLYESMLLYLKNKGVWMDGMRNIGSHWKKVQA